LRKLASVILLDIVTSNFFYSTADTPPGITKSPEMEAKDKELRETYSKEIIFKLRYLVKDLKKIITILKRYKPDP